MAGSQDDFMQALASLSRLANEYKSELQGLEEVEARFDKAQIDLNSTILQLQEVTTKLSLLPQSAAMLKSMTQTHLQLSQQAGVTVKNVDFSGERPRFPSGLEADGSLMLVLETTFPNLSAASAPKVLQFLLRMDKDARISSIQVLEDVLGSLTDVSSQLSEEIAKALELQNLTYLLRILKARIGK